MLEQFGREGDLQRYAAARRRMAIAQVLVCAVATHALFGFWPATALVSGALYAAAWTAWRHGGWLYAKTRRRWERNPKAAERDLSWFGLGRRP